MRYHQVARLSFIGLLAFLPLQSSLSGQKSNADAQVAGADDEQRPAMLVDASWSRLENALNGTRNLDTRLAAINALSLLGGMSRADRLVGEAQHDSDIDVRLAAIVAAGEMMHGDGAHSGIATEIRNQLNDPDPKVVFTSASTLWKLGDPSGEDILVAVAEGERSGNYSFAKSSRMNASRTLHSPAALAKIAAQQGMLMLVPPVGIGMGAMAI